MGMVPGQAWGMWPVMMQAAPGGGMYPMVAQWVPTAAMTAPDGGLPVRVVCRGCGLVRFDVEGRRWVHNHRQGKGNKQFVCNRVLCGCQKGQICPTRGHPHHRPRGGQCGGNGGPSIWPDPVQPGTRVCPRSSAPARPHRFATALAGASSSSSSSHSLQPSGGQAVAATLAVAQVPPARIAQVATATVAQVATEMVGAWRRRRWWHRQRRRRRRKRHWRWRRHRSRPLRWWNRWRLHDRSWRSRCLRHRRARSDHA